MQGPVQTIAVVRGAPGAVIQDLFRAVIEDWRPSVRLVGVVAEDHGLADRACSAGYLRSIGSVGLFSIFEDLGPGSTACHLEDGGAQAAAALVERDIAAGCDLVMLSKFGKLEASKQGLHRAFVAAATAGVPLLTALPPTFEAAWKDTIGKGFQVLQADAAAIHAWFRDFRREPSARRAGLTA